MIASLASLYLSVASGLGSYNIGRFFLRKAVEKRRERKAQASRDAKVDELVDEVLGIRERIATGNIDQDRARALYDMFKTAVASEKAPASAEKIAV